MSRSVVNHQNHGRGSIAHIAKKKKAFLAAFAECGIIAYSAQAAGVDRTTHYRWLKDDKKYEKDFLTAEQDAADELESEARRRAIEGQKKYKFTADGSPIMHPMNPEEPYYEHDYSDTLLIFMLKAKKLEYRMADRGGSALDMEPNIPAINIHIMSESETKQMIKKVANESPGNGHANGSQSTLPTIIIDESR